MGERATRDTAFERCVLPEIEVLLSVAHSLTRNHAEAEDLVQDTLVRAYRAIAGFDGQYPAPGCSRSCATRTSTAIGVAALSYSVTRTWPPSGGPSRRAATAPMRSSTT